MQKRRENVEKWRKERKKLNGISENEAKLDPSLPKNEDAKDTTVIIKESSWSLDKDEDEGDEEENQTIPVSPTKEEGETEEEAKPLADVKE